MTRATRLAFLAAAALFAAAHMPTSAAQTVAGTPRAITPYFYGMTLDSTIYYPGIWSSPSRYPPFPALMQGFRFSTLRYPGGLESECWSWQSGDFIGTNQGVPCSQFATVAPPGFDLGVLGQAIGSTAALPLFNLNLITATFDVATDPNNQMAMLGAAQASGINARLIELGNELYWQYPSYLSAFPTAEAYATAASNMAAEIHQRFPSADVKVAAVAASIPNPGVPRFVGWNAGLAALTNVDALTMHPYPHLDAYVPDAEIENPTAATIPLVLAIPFAGAAQFAGDVANLPPSLQAHPVWITEYGIWSVAKNVPFNKNVLASTWVVTLANTAFSMLLVQNARVDMLVNIHLANATSAIYQPYAIALNSAGSSAAVSTTGTIWSMFSNAAFSAQSIGALTFPSAIPFTANGKSYPGLVGIFFAGADGASALVANLTGGAQPVELASIFGTDVPSSFSYISAPPIDPKAAPTKGTGNIAGGAASLPAYSISLITSSKGMGGSTATASKIPTLSEYGLVLLAVALVVVGMLARRRREA